MEKGYVQVYTGDGKGKTTAAFGLAMRAVGRGYKVLVYQFLKGSASGETEAARRFAPCLEVRRISQEKYFWELDAEERKKLAAAVRNMLAEAADAAAGEDWDVIVLDEIMAAVNQGLVGVEEVLELIKGKNPGVELVLTGRNAPREILERSDLITEMKCVRHYYEQGVPARWGIEK